MLHELFVLGHVSFVWLFAGYFWDLCLLLELFALGHVNCVFTCASWIWFSIPDMRVLFCVYLNLFFDIFYLRQVLYLRDVSVTCVMFLCLIVFTWACPSVSCRLWIFSMGRICMSILTQVIHVWVMFSFLVGPSWSPFWPCGHWNLCRRSWPSFDLEHGCTRCFIAVIFYVFFEHQIFIGFPMQFLCTCMQLCTIYALFVHFLCAF